ncbi:MAG TPA: serine/threonine-protein kinase [Gemmata sp.]
MPSRPVCPTLSEIRAWAWGRYTPAGAEALAAHLERCATCARRFAAVSNDEPLSHLVRGLGPDLEGAGDDPPSVHALIEHLCQVEAPEDRWAAEEPEDLLDPPASPDELGRLGPYRVLERIGMGGMGAVFRAEDTQLARTVALKVLRPHLVASAAVRARFLGEARMAAALKHDHIVVIYQVGEVARGGGGSVPFIAMEFLEGHSLTDWLRRTPLPPLSVVIRFAREIASGLAAAHGRGIVHRDIKPGNVWVEAHPDPNRGDAGPEARTRIRLLDFGLACTGSEGAGSVAGTPAYMAPEQARGEPVDHRADLFALGRILSELLTGPAPQGHATGAPRPRRDSSPAAHRLHRLVGALLAPRPADRPGSAQAVEKELRSLESRLARPKTGRVLALAGSVLLVAGAVAFWFSGRTGRVEVTGERAVAVRNDAGEVTHLTAESGWRGNLPPGHYTAVTDDPEMAVEPPHFTIRAGETQRLALSGPPDGPVSDAWLRYVAGLPTDRQVHAVLSKLKALNPGFPGKCEFWAVQGGSVTEFRVLTDSIRDISPVRGLSELRVLGCFGSQRGKGQLSDLGPLKGLKLRSLCCWHNPISDLSPLRGMRLTEFQAEHTEIDDLTHLADMPIRTLTVQNTKVKELGPLRKMPLWLCYVNGCPVGTLEPLTATPVELLCCDFEPARDQRVLRSIPKLANINRLPAEHFWREVGLGRTPVP